MARTSFAISVSSEFTLIADGAVYSSVAIYVEDEEQVAIAIAAAAPNANSDNYFKLPNDGFNTDLDTVDKLYARALNGSVLIRGFRKTI